jgi:hypothetical protein
VLFSSRFANKHGRHWQFLFLIGGFMLSGCELIDTENISLPSQNMKLGGE